MLSDNAYTAATVLRRDVRDTLTVSLRTKACTMSWSYDPQQYASPPPAHTPQVGKSLSRCRREFCLQLCYVAIEGSKADVYSLSLICICVPRTWACRAVCSSQPKQEIPHCWWVGHVVSTVCMVVTAPPPWCIDKHWRCYPYEDNISILL